MIKVTQLVDRLKREPWEFPAAPADHGAHDVEQRAKAETHPCASCGEPAGAALVANTDVGPRWVDVCPDCYCDLLRIDPPEGTP